MPLIEAAATDPRNYVKKGVSWTLRTIGELNMVLNHAATELADRLAVSDRKMDRQVLF
ncbi:3-methyladenine DNA glycosylase AlkD [Sphingomonas sp. UYAg733]